MVKAKGACLANGLDLLKLPSAKVVYVTVNDKNYAFIVETDPDFNQRRVFRKSSIEENSAELNETVRQLGVFVARTGSHRFKWSDIAVFKITGVALTRMS